MKTMDLQSKKLELVQMILNIETPSLLEKLSIYINKEIKADWWDELPDTVKESVEIGLEQAKRGETIPHELVMDQFRAKYSIQK